MYIKYISYNYGDYEYEQKEKKCLFGWAYC